MTTLILDHFTGTNGDNVHGRTPDTTNTPGHTWQLLAGSMQLTSNQALSTVNADAMAFIDSGVSDGLITVTCVNVNSSSAQRVIFRGVDINNYWLAYITSNPAIPFQLYKQVSGSGTQVGSIGSTISTGSHVITIDLSGGTIIAKVDGANTITLTSQTQFQTATLHGFGSELTASSMPFDDFQVDGAAGGATLQIDVAD